MAWIMFFVSTCSKEVFFSETQDQRWESFEFCSDRSAVCSITMISAVRKIILYGVYCNFATQRGDIHIHSHIMKKRKPCYFEHVIVTIRAKRLWLKQRRTLNVSIGAMIAYFLVSYHEIILNLKESAPAGSSRLSGPSS
jgi:hypothetical protein